MTHVNRRGPSAAWNPRRGRVLRPFVPVLVLAASVAAASAWARQPVQPEPTRQRVPGFDIPPPPQDPQFPLLRGVFGEQDAGRPDTVPPTAATPTPTTVHPPAAPVPPPPESWDRAAEQRVLGGAGSGLGDTADASAANSRVILLVVTLLVATTLALIAILLRRGRLDRSPASIVSAPQSAAGVRRVDPRPGAGADRRGPAPVADRSPASSRRAAAASDSPTPPAG